MNLTRASGWEARRTETIGLSPGIDNMQGFLAAAGYIDAHVLHDFPDLPENVNDRGWATGKITVRQLIICISSS